MKQIIDKKIDLEFVELDGNAFVLMAAFKKQARNEGWASEEIKMVLNEAMSKDYDHLLQTLVIHTQ